MNVTEEVELHESDPEADRLPSENSAENPIIKNLLSTIETKSTLQKMIKALLDALDFYSPPNLKPLIPKYEAKCLKEIQVKNFLLEKRKRRVECLEIRLNNMIKKGNLLEEEDKFEFYEEDAMEVPDLRITVEEEEEKSLEDKIEDFKKKLSIKGNLIKLLTSSEGVGNIRRLIEMGRWKIGEVQRTTLEVMKMINQRRLEIEGYLKKIGELEVEVARSYERGLEQGRTEEWSYGEDEEDESSNEDSGDEGEDGVGEEG
jgi:hypothetical protein